MQPNDDGSDDAALSELSDAVRRLSDDVADLPGKIDDLASVLSGVGSLSPTSDLVILTTSHPAIIQRMNVTVDQCVADQLRAIDHPAAERLRGNTLIDVCAWEQGVGYLAIVPPEEREWTLALPLAKVALFSSIIADSSA
ncbi:hypothetical protein ACQREA_15375 [Dietzia cinnamea]|uniref:hypothetical protein n=1 Tax=Dietzia TaxID=37914 RepID=UPI00104C6A3A